MSRARTVPATMPAPAHGGVEKQCVVMIEAAIHTIELAEGHFAAIVLSRPSSDIAAIAILDRDEVEAHIQLLRNAMEDAELLDAGKAPIHTTESLRRS
jgi:hypothetical protein